MHEAAQGSGHSPRCGGANLRDLLRECNALSVELVSLAGQLYELALQVGDPFLEARHEIGSAAQQVDGALDIQALAELAGEI